MSITYKIPHSTALVLDLAAEGNSGGVVVMSTTVFLTYLHPAAL